MKKISQTLGKISITTPLINKVIIRAVHYHVDDITAVKSSHELAKNNPILKKQWTNGLTNNTFQHPSIGRITCEKQGCETKLCDKPCSAIKEKVYVGHMTHSDKYGKFISYKDFNNKQSSQYFVPYNPPVKNHDMEGVNTNKYRTENLNGDNENARTMIHIYSSHNPLDE